MLRQNELTSRVDVDCCFMRLGDGVVLQVGGHKYTLTQKKFPCWVGGIVRLSLVARVVTNLPA